MQRLTLVACIGVSSAFPSFRRELPNGHRVPCPPGAEGCYAGNTAEGQPASVCFGIGHASCKGGTMPLNPFGADMRKAKWTWSTELCQADSDDDGLTNGEELGDPCCLWAKDDTPSDYMKSFTPSHPGMKSHVIQNYVKPDCATTRPTDKATLLNRFNDGEEQRVMDLHIDNYTIPAKRTTYVDVAWNFDDDSHDIFHVVDAVAIVDQPRNLHHYVVRGCSKKFPPEMHGKEVSRQANAQYGCRNTFGGWAPGARIVRSTPWAGNPIGKKVGIVAFVVNVHFDNQPEESGIVSRDGMRLYYTPDLREMSTGEFNVMRIASNPDMQVPAGKKRFFLTRSCELSVMNGSKTGARAHLFGAGHHAHLLGTEMYNELTPVGSEKSIDLGSQPIWHFDDQSMENMLPRNISLQTGDHLQSTCVFDSTTRTKATGMGPETVDEMCFATSKTYPRESIVRCKGVLWMGELAPGESGMGIAKRHDPCVAEKVWDGRIPLTGGAVMKSRLQCAEEKSKETSKADGAIHMASSPTPLAPLLGLLLYTTAGHR